MQLGLHYYGSPIIASKVSQIIFSNENINTDVFVVFKTKHESKCQNEPFLKCHFSGNTSLNVFITEKIWWTFDVIIDDPTVSDWVPKKDRVIFKILACL